jgi:poly(3-hydroxybutyrate) depolymerase
MKKRDENPRLAGFWLMLTSVALILAFGSPACVDEDSSDDDTDAGADASSDTDTDSDTGPPDEIGPAGVFDESILVDGLSRHYQIHIPDSAITAMDEGPVGLLIGLHGAGDTADNFIAAVGLPATAASHGFIVIAPDGYNNGWFVQSDEGWPGTDGYSSSLENDMEFMLQMIAVTSASYYIDAGAIFVAGHSRGAGCSGLMAMFSGEKEIASGDWVTPFAAYGINAGYDASGGTVGLTSAEPKRPVWIIHGTSDAVVPYSMGESFYNDLNAAGWDVTFTSVTAGGHTWLWRDQYGQSNDDLWNFFMDNAN